jgi:hypothetical protein
MTYMIACPDCGKQTATANTETIRHDVLPIDIPVSKCWSCGFTWSDYVAEQIIEDYVKDQSNAK